MYFRTARRKKGDKLYESLYLMESYRTREGLRRFFGLEDIGEPLEVQSSRDFGGTYAIFRIWEQLGWSEVFERHLRGRGYGFDVVGNLKVLVANRLLDPMAKLHILEWWERVHLPGVRRDEITYNHLLQAMDFLIENKEQVEPELASPLLTLFDGKLDLVFYDLTSCCFEIDGEGRSGYPQVVLGLVMRGEGLPLCHYVFPGQTPDGSTLEDMAKDIKGCVIVADKGLLTEGNLRVLSDASLGYIVARPLRRDRIGRRVLDTLGPEIKKIRRMWDQQGAALDEREECFLDVTLDGRRFVLTHSEPIAK